MKTLEELKALGVKELQVSNGQAVAVNPYDEIDSFGPEWNNFEDLRLPPLPCAESVKEGRYSIDRFSEQWQEQRLNGWINVTNEYIEKVTTWETYYNIHETETRTLLILSEPVVESDQDISDYVDEYMDAMDKRYPNRRDEVAEKPEGEPVAKSKVPENYPGKEYQSLFNLMFDEHGLILLQSEMDDIILVVKDFLTANPKQY